MNGELREETEQQNKCSERRVREETEQQNKCSERRAEGGDGATEQNAQKEKSGMNLHNASIVLLAYYILGTTSASVC